MSVDLRCGFIGSGRFAARCLELLSEWLRPSWIAVPPARRAGRGNKLTPSPVAVFASESELLSGVPIVETSNASTDPSLAAIRAEHPTDFIFVIDFGQLIREPLLGENEHIGCLNVHPSLLPSYRGAAPVQRAIMNGDDEIGVTIFKLARGMDSGPVLLQRSFASGDMDAGEALDRAAEVGIAAFKELAESSAPSAWTFVPQDDDMATHAAKIASDEERIDWSMSAEEIARRVRALAPRPGAWTTVGGKRLRVLRASAASLDENRRAGELIWLGRDAAAATGSGALRFEIVQPEGKKIQSADDWRNGLRASDEVMFE